MNSMSTIVLEGEANNLPTLAVNESGTIDGTLVIRISLPSTFSSYGIWMNYTIVTCQQQCRGSFRSVLVEGAGNCAKIEESRQFSGENSHHISVLFTRVENCFVAALLPSLAVVATLIECILL